MFLHGVMPFQVIIETVQKNQKSQVIYWTTWAVEPATLKRKNKASHVNALLVLDLALAMEREGGAQI
jgi:hypothetical protein